MMRIVKCEDEMVDSRGLRVDELGLRVDELGLRIIGWMIESRESWNWGVDSRVAKCGGIGEDRC